MRQKKLWHRTFNDDGKRFESFVKENVLPITRSNVSSFDLIWSDHHHVWMSILSCIHVKFYALQFYVNASYTLKSGMNEDSQRKWALPLLLNLTQIHANWQPSLWQQFMQCASQHSTAHVRKTLTHVHWDLAHLLAHYYYCRCCSLFHCSYCTQA